MKKFFLTLAVAAMTLFATAQTNQYFWYQGNLMMGNPIAQIDSVTFGENEPTDTLHILLPRTIIKEVHDTVEIAVHDTLYITNYTCLPEGALPGEFSVSPTKKVRFSKGNLQYNAALGNHQCADGTTKQGTWRFAEHQWDYVGDATNGTVYENGVKCDDSKISSTYAGWIDLFGWGTSGWNSGANAYQPWSNSTSYSDYYPGGSYTNDLTSTYAHADWGVYNQIGDEPAGTWRTLTRDEWSYLFGSRANSTNLRGQATVNGVKGLILLPDGWTAPAGITFTSGTGVGFDKNVYSSDDWENKLEPSGAVFLPAGGRRNGSVGGVQSDGYYWSATASNDVYAWRLGFIASYSDMDYRYIRHGGLSVRLAQDVE